MCECKLGHEEREEAGLKVCVGKLPECSFSVDLCIMLGNNLGRNSLTINVLLLV